MNSPKMEHDKVVAEKVVANLQKRGMHGFYCESPDQACQKVSSLISADSMVSWGGTMTCEEISLFDMLKKRKDITLLDRGTTEIPEEQFFQKVFSSDTYIMSSNAVTVDGKLVNVDGRGNRVASLIFGPKEVIVVCGMNKVVSDEHAAFQRIQSIAAPINCRRLQRKTPCFSTGSCAHCLSDDSICSNSVVTRRSHVPGRIKVVLVAGNYGY